MTSPQSIARLGRGWERHLRRLLEAAEHSLTVSSAYVSSAGVDFLVEHAAARVLEEGQVTVLTDLSPEHAAQGATDPEALARLYDRAAHVRLVHLPRLHSKVYVADEQQAIVTSGNLTAGGLRLNYEYGLHLLDPLLVAGVRRDVLDVAALGARLDRAGLDAFCAHAREAKDALAQASAPAHAQERFREAVRRAKDVLLQGYTSGEPIHTVFERTVLYVLGREGPMTTAELHSHVQAIHPDLCDDEDRIIDGENFGRKWKHAVRTAQQHLKRRGEIALGGDHQWQRVEHPDRVPP